MKKILSIIIPVYNVEKYLKKCLDSIVLQSEQDCEILLIDDGSTDSSSQICDEYQKKYKNVKSFHKENAGLSDARNYGIKKSSGEYLWFIDSDDFLEKNSVNRMLDLCAKSETDVIVCRSKIIDENKNIYDECRYSIKEGLYTSDEYMDLLKNNPKSVIFCAQYHICKKELIEKFDLYFYKGIIHEDELWTPQILLAAKNIYYSNLNVYYHLMRSNSIMHASDLKKSGKCDLFIATKLFKVFDSIKNKKLEYLKDRCVNIYLQSVWKVPDLVNNCIDERKKILSKSYYIKTKFKAYLYLLSPKLYLIVHSMLKK